MPYQKDELVVFDGGELKGQTGKFLKYLDAPYALILVNENIEKKSNLADFMRQKTMVQNYVGFEPLGYIAKDGLIIGFLDQNDTGYYLAVRLDDDGVNLDHPLPWGSSIAKAIATWADEPIEDLDSLYEKLVFMGYVPFEIPEDYTHNLGLTQKSQQT